MKRKWTAALLCIVILCGLAQAETPHTLTLELLNDWVIARGGAVVYRDAEMTKPWGNLPGFMLLQRRFDLKDGRTAVANGRYLGYIASDALTELKEGDWLYAACSTRAYQKPSLKSRWVNVRQGLPVQLVAVTGSCAMVRRGSIVAYMYVGHLRPILTEEAV